MSYPAYPEYKDSGVEWLGKVPVHWDVVKLKRLCQMQSGDFISPSEIEDEGVYPVYGGNGRRGFTPSYTHSGLYPIVGRQGALCGNVNYASGKFWASEHAVVASPEGKISPAWLGEVLRAMDLNQYSITAAQPGLAVDKIKNLYTPRLALNEQESIATFLNHETARIDALVEQQQRLIELLKEKRQAVISHAVTKGLDPDVPMKDSTVEWLGEVPEHWRVAPLKYLVTEKVAGPYGASLTKAMYTTSGHKVYGQQQIIPNDFSLGDYYISQEKFEEMSRYKVFPGDVLFSVMGTVGKVAVVPPDAESGIINPRLVRYRFFRRVNPDFLRLLVMSQHYQGSLQESAQGSTMEGLNMAILGDLPVLLPDFEEQNKIVARLTQEGSLLEELVSQAKYAIDLLSERRSALISAAVTGKIDVRGWQPPVGLSKSRETADEV